MEKKEMLRHIDHTLLRATASWEEICKLCEESIAYKTASVCVPPCYVRRIHEKYGERVNICTVIGFPLGYQTPDVKEAEAKQAVADGAQEIDMVINLTDVKNRDYDSVEREISLLKKAVGKKVLKVIVETCYLTEEEKIAMCHAVTNGGADYIKTSTGFGTAGAAIADIELFKKHIGPEVKIKAAGGIKTVEDLERFLNAGCERIGTSSAVRLLTEE